MEGGDLFVGFYVVRNVYAAVDVLLICTSQYPELAAGLGAGLAMIGFPIYS